MRIGVMLPVSAMSSPGVPQPYAEIRELALAAESGGLDTIWVYDHLLDEGPEKAAESPWEAWTVLTGLAEATSTVRLGCLVFCTAFRPPAVLARMADTLQDLSDNRLVLGLGAGWHKPEFDAFGIPFDHLAGRFDEATQIITTMLRDGRATFDGTYYSVTDAPVRERPGRVPPNILIAAKRPRMLEITARYADTWNLAWYGMPSDAFRESNRELTEACEKVGRDPATLERTAGLLVGMDHEKSLPLDASAVAEAFTAWSAEGVAEVICTAETLDTAAIEVLCEARRTFTAQR
jgi:alkanesulfonate monooxygenase SsuD/methylene tetrahydromethanopterin reductase-like flavin-dependent oxidoreductase (luciferase family)